MNRSDLALRSLSGLRLGDAFGERFLVGEPAESLDRIANRELPSGVWPWTDDTAQAHTLTEHLLSRGEVVQDELALAFAQTFLADPARGYGRGAHDLLLRIALGEDWRTLTRAAFGGMGSMGNGAAMRVAPLGAYFCHDLDAVAREAYRSAEVSHGNINAIAGAVGVAIATAGVATDKPDDELWHEILERTPPCLTRDRLAAASRLPTATVPTEAARTLGSGERLCAHDTVPFCVWIVLTSRRAGYEECLWRTLSGLGDCDTTCAIVGGMLAANEEIELPPTWLDHAEPIG